MIGAGPNGLTAAAVLARAGLRVLVLEANEQVGGAARSAEATRPGFVHDLFSAFYPLFPVGPIGQLGLGEYGLTWCGFEKPFAGGTPSGPGVAVLPDPAESIASFERAHRGDGAGYAELWEQWQRGGPAVLSLLFNPIGSPAPLAAAGGLGTPARALQFAQTSVAPADQVARRYFGGEDARVWYIGSPLHSDLGPRDAGGGLYGLVMMGLGQQVGMPIPQGGAQAIPDALVRFITGRGGIVLTRHPVDRVIVRNGRAQGVTSGGIEFRASRGIIATVPPTRLFGTMIGHEHLPPGFIRTVRRFRWGSGVFKLDLALSGLPSFASEALQGAGVLHLGRSALALTSATNQVTEHLLPEAPPLIAGIQTLADPSRAPAGCHTLWLETHVPSLPLGDAAGRLKDEQWAVLREPFAERLIDELARFAPEIRDHLLAFHAQTPEDLEAGNANLVGGDIAGGSFSIDQQLVFRPMPGWFRHAMPIRGLYLGGASAHPGGGVHGAAGSNAARVLLQDIKIASLRETAVDGFQQLRTWFGGTGPRLA